MRKNFSICFSTVALIVFFIEILLRIAGLGSVFDEIDKSISESKQEALENSQETFKELTFMNSELIGSWRAEDVNFKDLEDAEVTLTFMNDQVFELYEKEGNAFSLKRGAYQLNNSRLVLIPTVIKTNRGIIDTTTSKKDLAKNTEEYNLTIENKKLKITDIADKEGYVLKQIKQQKTVQQIEEPGAGLYNNK